MTRNLERNLFLKNLSAVANRFSFELDETLTALYDKSLSPLGYNPLNHALEKIQRNGAPGNCFPSVAYIRKLTTGEQMLHEVKQDDVDARVISAKMFEAVSKFGTVIGTDESAWQKFSEIASFVGPIGWDVISRHGGGWNLFCESITNSNRSYLLAHYRDLIRKSAKSGLQGSKSAVPKLPIIQRAKEEPLSVCARTRGLEFTNSLLEMLRSPKKSASV